MITKQDADYIFKNIALIKKTYEELSKEYNVHKTTLCKQMNKFKTEYGIQKGEKYSAYTYLRYYYGKEIIQKYVEELRSTESIIRDYGLSDASIIVRILKFYDIEIRQTGYISKTIQSLFNDITNEIEAYTLGLISADGNVGKNYSINIFLTESDKYLLEEINARLLNNTGHILISKKENGEPVARLSFCGKLICQNLKKYNIVPNKSKVMTQILEFDEPLMRHYLRGLYDGDGVCSKSNNLIRIGYCAYREEFVKSYKQFFVKKLDMNNNKLFNTGNCWQCSWAAKKDLINFYNYIYQDSAIYLKRKQEKLFNYLYGNSEVTK